MKYAVVLTALLAAASATVAAQEAPAPEECLATKRRRAVTVDHGGKTYRLANEACRAQFLTDPERYAQLYDALEELERAGTPLEAAPASLVPS